MSKTMRTPTKNSPKQSSSTSAVDKPNKRPRPNTSPQQVEKYHDKQEEILSMLSQVLLELSEMRKSNVEMQKTLEFYSKNFENLNTRIKSLEEEKQHQNMYINKLETKLEDLERHSRASCIEIRGIPPKKSESKTELITYINRIHTKINVQTESNIIKDIYRLSRKPNGERPIVVEYTTNLFKDKILQATKKYNSSNTTDRMNTISLGFEGNKTPVYISELLTPKARRLFFLARDVTKQIGYDFCWTANGKVLMRKTEGLSLIVISNEKQLEDLKQKN
ncbi:uncharacterized protein LOC121733911 [Aricia agestis]|uniref:uncharacterized protein LOC121733911 n=1 Tax=Aricia agestis TaxID=91739 RepID=UPI001C20927F|nr:uncharacterized protein LOC121733911 [Aricia agestis]